MKISLIFVAFLENRNFTFRYFLYFLYFWKLAVYLYEVYFENSKTNDCVTCDYFENAETKNILTKSEDTKTNF